MSKPKGDAATADSSELDTAAVGAEFKATVSGNGDVELSDDLTADARSSGLVETTENAAAATADSSQSAAASELQPRPSDSSEVGPPDGPPSSSRIGQQTDSARLVAAGNYLNGAGVEAKLTIVPHHLTVFGAWPQLTAPRCLN